MNAQRTVRDGFVILGPLPWCVEAEIGLNRAFWGLSANRTAQAVHDGTRQLWLITSETMPARSAWVVTEIVPDTLFVWCIQGQGAVRVVRLLGKIAVENKLSKVSFFTHHRAALYGFRKFNPEVTRLDGTEMHFRMSAQALAGDSHGKGRIIWAGQYCPRSERPRPAESRSYAASANGFGATACG